MVRLTITLFLVFALFGSCSDDSTSPEIEELTLDGTWAINEFSTEIAGEYRILLPPDQVNTQLFLDSGKYKENGNILASSFIDSGTVTDTGDSLEFYSLVYRKTFKGKLLQSSLVIIKNMTQAYFGTATYKKRSN